MRDRRSRSTSDACLVSDSALLILDARDVIQTTPSIVYGGRGTYVNPGGISEKWCQIYESTFMLFKSPPCVDQRIIARAFNEFKLGSVLQ